MEKKRWVFILMALCLALVFSVSSVEAEVISKCNKDGDNYVKARPSSCLDLLLDETLNFIGIDCDDNTPDLDGFGGEPCEDAAFQCDTPNVRVGWADIEVSEETQTRLCVPAMIQEQGNGGSYTCAINFDDEVKFNLLAEDVEQIQKQGNDDVCSYFVNDGSFIPSRLYGMSWAGPCLVGDPCLVRVAMWSHMTDTAMDGGDPIIHESRFGGDIALGFTRVVATLLLEPLSNSDGDAICNPLNGEEDLQITDISIRVQRPGKSHKILADCQWSGPPIMFSIVPD